MTKPTRASRPAPGLTTLVWLTSVCASCAGETSTTGHMNLDPVAVSQVPPSRNVSIALASEDTAWVMATRLPFSSSDKLAPADADGIPDLAIDGRDALALPFR